jgi:hypothetical protein
MNYVPHTDLRSPLGNRNIVCALGDPGMGLGDLASSVAFSVGSSNRGGCRFDAGRQQHALRNSCWNFSEYYLIISRVW